MKLCCAGAPETYTGRIHPWVRLDSVGLCVVVKFEKNVVYNTGIILSLTSDQDCQQTNWKQSSWSDGDARWDEGPKKAYVYAMFTCFVNFNVHIEW